MLGLRGAKVASIRYSRKGGVLTSLHYKAELLRAL